MRQRAISAIKGLASGDDESDALRLHGNHFAHTALIQRVLSELRARAG